MAELRDRERHESAFARKLAGLGVRHRRELAALLGSPPDPNRVTPEFWSRVEKETQEEMAVALLLIFALTATQHGMADDRAQGFATAFASTESRRLADLFTRNSARIMLRGVAGKRSGMEIAGEIFGESRAAIIARTATTSARSAGIVQSARDPGTDSIGDDGKKISRELQPVLAWELEVVRKVAAHCSFCPMMAATDKDYWGKFLPAGPPAHVLCACGIRVLPPGTPVMTATPSDATVIAAARDSGVFGY